MKKNLKRILRAASLMIIVFVSTGLISKVYNIDPEMWKAMGLDPNASSVSISVEEAEARMAQAARNRPDLFTDDFVQSVGGTPSGSSSQSAPATSSGSQAQTKTDGKKGEEKTSAKVTAYFTDAYGHVLGSSQITSGTTIGDNQFVKDVPDCDGKKFDGWDYDGRKLYHDIIVRANYK